MMTIDTNLKDVYQLLFSPDGAILAVNTIQQGAHLLNAQTFKATTRYVRSGSLACTPDGIHWAINDMSSIMIHTLGKSSLNLDDTGHPNTKWNFLRFSQDNKFLEASGMFTQGYARWDATTGRKLHDSCSEFGVSSGSYDEVDGTVEGLSYSLCAGKRLTVITTKAHGKKAKSAAVVFDGDIEKGRIRIDNKGGFPYPLLISSDGRYLAVRWVSVIGIWNLETLKPVTQIRVDRKPFLDAALAPDSRHLVTVTNNDERIRVWDLASGRQSAEFDWGIGKPTAVAVAPDGLRIACANAKGQLVIWDAE